MQSGIVPNPCMCTGCEKRLDNTTAVVCGFLVVRSPILKIFLPRLFERAALAAYHPKCIRVGEPFRTHHDNGVGLQYPAVATAPGFMCEACIMRAMLGRELTLTTADHRLLCLERMRLIDAAHAWAPSTVKTYQTRLHQIQCFERAYQVMALQRLCLVQPSPAIAVMWAMQEYI